MDAKQFIEDLKPLPYMVPDPYPGENLQYRMEVLFTIAEAICPGFILDSKTRNIYENAVLYFSANFKSSFTLTKGLYLYGPVGCGKTNFFKIFQKLNTAYHSKNNYDILTVNDMIDGYAREGNKFFSDAGITSSNNPLRRIMNPRSNDDIMIDDLGQSSRFTSHFGNTINIVSDTIARRYNAYTDYSCLTHVSTNIVPSKIEAEYGKFIASRMRSMFNIVKFPGEDKRK